MAGNDELIYRVKLEKDPASFSEMAKSLKDMEEKAQKIGEGEGAEATTEFAEAIREMNESTAEGIERLIELQTQIDDYKGTLKEIREAKKGDVEISQQQRQQEAETRTALKATRKEYRDTEKAVIAASQAGEGQAKTYNEISAENRNLAAEMKNIPFDDTTGRLDSLKEQWAKNNKALKEFDAEMGDHRRNVGNYSEAMSTAASAVAAFQGPLGPIAGRINSVNTTIQRSIPLLKAKIASWGALRVAMLATGIGAIVVALGTLITALSTMQPIIDQVAKRWAQLGAVWGNIKDGIGALFGFNERTNQSMRDSIRIAGELADAQVRLDEARIESITILAELETEVSNLRRAAEDETNSHEERIEMMERAQEATREMMQIQIEQAEEERRIAEQRAGLARNERSDDEAVQEARAEVIRLRGQEQMQLRQLTRRRQSIINQKRTETERIRSNIRAIQDEVREREKASRARIDQAREEGRAMLDEAMLQRRIDLLREFGREEQAIEAEFRREIAKVDEEFREDLEEAREESFETRIKLAEKFRNQGDSEEEAWRKAHLRSQEQFLRERNALIQRNEQQRRAILFESEMEVRDIERERRDERLNIRQQIAKQEQEQEMMRNALMQNVRSDAHREMIRLEVEFEQRKNELKAEFDEKGFSQEEARQLAHQQSMLVFEEQFQQAKTQIQQREQQERLQMIDHFTDISNNLMVTAFGDMKEVRIAQAIIDTLAGANRALSESPPGLRWLEFAAVMTAGMANVAQIRRTELGSNEGAMQSASGAQGGLSSSRGFEVIDDRQDGMVARQVAETSSDRNGEGDPTFVFEGDLDSEVMAIKVRKGNRTIDSKTLTTKSKA